MRTRSSRRGRIVTGMAALACAAVLPFAGASSAFAGTHHWATGGSYCGTAVCGVYGGGEFEADCHASSNSVYVHRLDGPTSNKMRMVTFHTASAANGCTPTAVICDVTANTDVMTCNPGGRTARGAFSNLDNNYHSFNAHTTY